MIDLFEIYQDAYLTIRAKYQHPDEPVLHRRVYCETLPPRGWDRATYSAYFDEAIRLTDWYLAAWEYAAKKRKRPEDRADYLAACDRYGVAGHDLRFEGEPSQDGLF